MLFVTRERIVSEYADADAFKPYPLSVRCSGCESDETLTMSPIASGLATPSHFCMRFATIDDDRGG